MYFVILYLNYSIDLKYKEEALLENLGYLSYATKIISITIDTLSEF